MSNWFIDGGKFWLLEKITMFLFENLRGYEPPYPGGPNPPISFPQPQEPSPSGPKYPVLPIGPIPLLPL